MQHKPQTSKALSLFGLILMGLFCAAQSAAVFTQGPTVAQQGDSAVSITFTVSEATDVEVGIADANGKIINHLAAGVLGGTYPPPEPLTAGLSQNLVWDFRDDDGGVAMGSGYKVRVRLVGGDWNISQLPVKYNNGAYVFGSNRISGYNT